MCLKSYVSEICCYLILKNYFVNIIVNYNSWFFFLNSIYLHNFSNINKFFMFNWVLLIFVRLNKFSKLTTNMFIYGITNSPFRENKIAHHSFDRRSIFCKKFFRNTVVGSHFGRRGLQWNCKRGGGRECDGGD